jgi:hypothetical protein
VTCCASSCSCSIAPTAAAAPYPSALRAMRDGWRMIVLLVPRAVEPQSPASFRYSNGEGPGASSLNGRSTSPSPRSLRSSALSCAVRSQVLRYQAHAGPPSLASLATAVPPMRRSGTADRSRLRPGRAGRVLQKSRSATRALRLPDGAAQTLRTPRSIPKGVVAEALARRDSAHENRRNDGRWSVRESARWRSVPLQRETGGAARCVE